MTRFQVLTLFPELIRAGISAGVLSQGIKRSLLEVTCYQLRDFSSDSHRRVDDRPFGGDDGMILLAEVLESALTKVRERGPTYVIYMSPQGTPLRDSRVQALAKEPSITLLCGRYGGVDQRALNSLIDEEISVGDYVLSGGELPALTLIDAVSRYLPGVLGDESSVYRDSFSKGLLEHPHFTRPREWMGQRVPEVLLSGNHGKIQDWQDLVARLVTLKKRPDLLHGLAEQDWDQMRLFWQGLSVEDRIVCGVENLILSDFQRKRS